MEAYRLDAKANHQLFTKVEREKLLAPYLPPPPPRPDATIRTDRQRTRTRLAVGNFLRVQVYFLCYIILHNFFSLYIRCRIAYHVVIEKTLSILYYHHRTPELIQKDVKKLTRLPTHLSVILTLDDKGHGRAGFESLVDEVAEISAWCACAGIPMLSIYEKTGLLKEFIPTTHKAVTEKLSSYLGNQLPAISVQSPHIPSVESPTTSTSFEISRSASQHLSILLLSAEDGRDSLVDLTKTLAEMAQRSKLIPRDISVDLIDSEISESVMGEPDLLVLFTPSVELSGYPPWQIRLTEIFHVQDNQGVGYQVFLRALHNYANAQMKFGR
ncbi:hypothetical protein K3495_g5901 [Podosphaera aphanis]|nr:hypothetical protein K3495_g5901 [Podosphaera aphanis]